MLSDRLTFLKQLPRGPALRKIFSVLLWVLAALTIFAGLYFIIDMFMALSQAELPAAVLGTIIAALATAVGTALIVLTILHHLPDLRGTSPPDYPVIHLVALLLRLLGEGLAAFHLAAGLATGIAFWFGSRPSLPYFQSLMWRILGFAAFPPFISGLIAILASVFQAALSLLACYLAAELLLLLRELPLKTKR